MGPIHGRELVGVALRGLVQGGAPIETLAVCSEGGACRGGKTHDLPCPLEQWRPPDPEALLRRALSSELRGHVPLVTAKGVERGGPDGRLLEAEGVDRPQRARVVSCAVVVDERLQIVCVFLVRVRELLAEAYGEAPRL